MGLVRVRGQKTQMTVPLLLQSANALWIFKTSDYLRRSRHLRSPVILLVFQGLSLHCTADQMILDDLVTRVHGKVMKWGPAGKIGTFWPLYPSGLVNRASAEEFF